MSVGAFPADLCGLRLIEVPTMVIGPFEDWTAVRSPARARRRRRKGFAQRIRLYFRPDPNLMMSAVAVFGHPETIRALKAKVAETQL